MNTIKNRIFLAFALLSLATVAGASTGTSRDVPAEDLLEENYVSVSRLAPFEEVDDLEQDHHVATIAADTSSFCQQNVGEVTAIDLARYLTELHGGVGTPYLTEYEYVFRIDPEGNIYRVCILVMELEIDDGGASPICVSVHQTIEV